MGERRRIIAVKSKFASWDAEPDSFDGIWTEGARVKLWHDDVRRPPDDSWIWARTNDDALEILRSRQVDVLSMDHDLGGSDIPLNKILSRPHEADYLKLDGETTGVDLADAIGREDLYPPEIIVHSMNSVGAGNIMARFLHWSKQSERECVIRQEPFSR